MIHVKLLGPTIVEVDGQALPEAALVGRRRQVLEILAMNAGTPVPKEVLADQVWEGAPPPAYLGTLESYVCVLRKRLGIAGRRHSCLGTCDRGYVLEGEEVQVDLHVFRNLVRAGAHRPAAERIRRAVCALELVRGPLLAQEPYAAWAVQARDVFARTITEALVPLAALANSTGEYDAARTLANVVITQDAYSELAWQELIRAHWLAGDGGEALRAYAGLRQLLLEELGEQPSRRTQDLYMAVLRSRDGHPEARHQELRLLLRLLRQALDACPGVTVPHQDADLVGTASLLEHAVFPERSGLAATTA